jgi:L-aminopeptidase/D-esterase-like protein
MQFPPQTRLAVAAGIAALVAAAPAQAGQDELAITTGRPGPTLQFDWPAVQIGVATYEAGPTGVTVIRFPKRASAAVDVRGGAPGTLMTDALRLGSSRGWIDAIVLSAGSSYGLEAVAGVAGALKDDGVRSGAWGDIAGVAGAIVYDFLGHRLNEIYPDKRLAQAALRAAKPGVFPLGAQGAGRAVMQGWFFGCGAHSGQGAAFRQVGETRIAAFVVVNAYGSVTDRDGKLVNCHRGANWGALTRTAELLAHVPESRDRNWAPPADGSSSQRNTTISVILTNRKIGWYALQRLAVQVHTSMARAIQPFSTFDDGDTLFALSTDEIEQDKPSLIDLDTIAAETMWDAILASVPKEDAFVPPTTAASVAPDLLGR